MLTNTAISAAGCSTVELQGNRSVPAAGVEPAAFAFSARRSYRLSCTGIGQRSWWESNPRQAVLRTAALPLGPQDRARAASAGVEPTRPGFRAQVPSEGLAGKNQGWVAGYDPAPRRSQCRMQSHYTIPTIGQHPRQESNLVYDLRKVACDPAHPGDVVAANQSEIGESNPVVSCSQGRRLPISPISETTEWTVEGVEPSSAGCKPAVFPLDDTPVSETVTPVGVEPTTPWLRARCSAH